jgi:dihydropteroate synthase
VVAEVRRFLLDRMAAAHASGIDPARLLLDPGIGFGKAIDHNLTLLRHLKQLSELRRPLVVGTSRKGFIGKITGESEPARRILGTAATTAWAVANGAAIVRVHDVAANVQVVRMIEAIAKGFSTPG